MNTPLSIAPFLLLTTLAAVAQESSKASAPFVTPVGLAVPMPGPTNDAPYAPQPILQGGVIMALYPSDSPQLRQDRLREAEYYNMSKAVPGRISSITNIHNPSIEVHTVEGGLNTGAAIVLAAGGGHNTLNVGSESADFVPYFYNYGVNTVILRNRLTELCGLAEDEVKEMDTWATEVAANAVKFAEEAPLAEPEELFTDVVAEHGPRPVRESEHE